MNGATHNQAVAEQLQATMRRHKSAMRANGPKAVGPGGKIVDAEEYLRAVHSIEKHSSLMADLEQFPEKYLKDPRPGWHYLWISPKDEYAKARVNSGRYREVLTEELLPEHDLAYTDGALIKRIAGTHTGTSRAVMHFDLQLVSCSPETWNALFKFREAMGMKKVTSGVEEFYARMDAEGVDSSFEMTAAPRGS